MPKLKDSVHGDNDIQLVFNSLSVHCMSCI